MGGDEAEQELQAAVRRTHGSSEVARGITLDNRITILTGLVPQVAVRTRRSSRTYGNSTTLLTTASIPEGSGANGSYRRSPEGITESLNQR